MNCISFSPVASAPNCNEKPIIYKILYIYNIVISTVLNITLKNNVNINTAIYAATKYTNAARDIPALAQDKHVHIKSNIELNTNNPPRYIPSS